MILWLVFRPGRPVDFFKNMWLVLSWFCTIDESLKSETYLCLSVSVSFCLSLSVCLSICLSVCLSLVSIPVSTPLFSPLPLLFLSSVAVFLLSSSFLCSPPLSLSVSPRVASFISGGSAADVGDGGNAERRLSTEGTGRAASSTDHGGKPGR